MCGIFVAQKSPEYTEQDFSRALNSLEKRGPDGSRYISIDEIYFGFTRLAIIDLDERSMQPMVIGNTVLLMNGELYNYKDLRSTLEAKGYTFNTLGDAEILATAIEEWGIKKAFEHARGMWGCVIYNLKTKQLFLCRDRLGIKPLWYKYLPGHKLVIGSDIQSLMRLGHQSDEIDIGQVQLFVTDGIMFENQNSCYKHIHAIPPGVFASLDVSAGSKGELVFNRYWSPSSFEVHMDDASLGHLKSVFLETLKLHLQSDVPVGLALSGGLDSTILAGYANGRCELSCFSLRHPIADHERHLVDQTVEMWDLNHCYVESSKYDNIEVVKQLVEAIGYPFRATQTIYQYAIRKEAAERGIKVLLTGDGADEVFGGYTYCVKHMIAALINDELSDDASRLASEMESFVGIDAELQLKMAQSLLEDMSADKYVSPRVPLVSSPELFGELYDPELQHRNIHSTYVPGLKSFLIDRLVQTPIPYWMAVEDSISMQVSLETRVPFLDSVLIDASFAYPEKHFMGEGLNKRLLRLIADDYLPPHIKNARTKYQRPGSNSLLIYGALAPALMELLASPDRLHLLNHQNCQKAFQRDLAEQSKEMADFWFRVLTYSLWVNA